MAEPNDNENAGAARGDAPETPDGARAEASDSAVLLAELTAGRDQAIRERDEYYDRLLRVSAEFDNFRRRTQRERAEFVEFAGAEIVRELLPVLDDFERALRHETADKDYAKGIELIYNRFADTLRKAGLEPLEVDGKPFDPHMHHAVERVPTEEVEEGTIVGEHQRGYNFKGRLLRPAMVKVAVKP
ncbi:MAG: nucleotide exchange factor GrpE [bacterium]|jgi:molecular chaperone GrpE